MATVESSRMTEVQRVLSKGSVADPFPTLEAARSDSGRKAKIQEIRKRMAVFDRYSNSFLKIYFEIPPGREDEPARKVLVTHLQSGNSYGIRLKEKHAKFPQPELGPWVEGSKTVGADYTPPVLEGWEPAEGH